MKVFGITDVCPPEMKKIFDFSEGRNQIRIIVGAKSIAEAFRKLKKIGLLEGKTKLIEMEKK